MAFRVVKNSKGQGLSVKLLEDRKARDGSRAPEFPCLRQEFSLGGIWVDQSSQIFSLT